MALELLLQQLVPGAPGRERAARDLLEWVAREVRLPAACDRDEIASQVVFELLKRAVSGKQLPDDPDSYVRKMVRNAVINLSRRKARMRPLEDAGEREAPGDETAVMARLERDIGADVARARVMLRELFGGLLQSGMPRYRAEWQRAFHQLEGLVFEGADLRTMVMQENEIEAGEAVVQVALARAYTAHRRLRDRLAQSVELLESTGRISGARARELRGCLALLLRAGVRAG